MITLKDACHIAQADNESVRIIGCYDCDSSYGFVTVSRSWKGGPVLSLDFPVGNNVLFVKKSDGQIFFEPIMDAMDKINSGKKLGIGNFLTEEDRNFIQKIEKEQERS